MEQTARTEVDGTKERDSVDARVNNTRVNDQKM